MKLDRHSKLARFSYFFRERVTDVEWVYSPPNEQGFVNAKEVVLWDSKVPKTTTLCAFFWRTFVFMPLAWLAIAGAVGTPTFFYARAWWQHPKTTLFATIGTILCGIFIVAFINLLDTLKYSDNWQGMVEYVVESTFVQGLKAIKSKYCPLIDFTDAPEHELKKAADPYDALLAQLEAEDYDNAVDYVEN